MLDSLIPRVSSLGERDSFPSWNPLLAYYRSGSSVFMTSGLRAGCRRGGAGGGLEEGRARVWDWGRVGRARGSEG